MTEPKSVVDPPNMLPAGVNGFLMPRAGKRHNVPSLLFRKVIGNNLRTEPFHLEAEEATGGAHFEHALATKIDVTQVVADPVPQLPFPLHAPLHRTVHAAL